MLKIYGVPISVHTRKVIVAALHKGLSFEVIPVVPVIPDKLPPNWRVLSPTGKIPAMQHDDFTLADSTAICGYLDRAYPDQPIYPTGDARAYARALWWEQYSGSVFSNVVHPLFFETFVNPNVNKIPTDKAKVDHVLLNVAPEMFGYLDSQIAEQGFLAGSAPTVPDWHLASALTTMQYLGCALDGQRFARLGSLFQRTIRTPAMRQALRDEQPAVQGMGLKSDFLSDVLT
jgi:glutathione S-transferase